MSPHAMSADASVERLSSGAAAVVTADPGAKLAVVGFGGGSPRPRPDADSPSLRWIVRYLSRTVPGLELWDVRYRLASWHQLDMCVADGNAAVRRAAESGLPVALVGFSMGGAVATAVADHPSIRLVAGASPWFPDDLDLGGLRGRRVAVVHGALDGWFPGVPGVPVRHSRSAVQRMRADGVDATHQVVRGAIHPYAVRGAGDRLIPAPGATRRARLLAAQVIRQRDEVSASSPASVAAVDEDRRWSGEV